MRSRSLSQYQIVEKLGSGSMGDVYRARDTKLGRDVAIKRISEAFARDEERLARFEREARILASLNHPGIAAVYGLERSEKDVEFLVIELVEGETLQERIARGPIPIREALGLFRQVAAALDAAHEKGIIHRDLKPANLKITPEGHIKVLDFGLAKDTNERDLDVDLSQSPTLTRAATLAGVILGTAPYMSPEQARGKDVTKRTDIWAFGCCLFESLTGRPAFGGDTATDILARILEREPPWELLPGRTPALVRSLLRRCLRKDPRRRLHDIGDALIEIEESMTDAEAIAPSFVAVDESSSFRRRLLTVALSMTAVGLALFLLSRFVSRSVRVAQRPTHFMIALEAGQELSSGPSPSVAISRDGNRIAYVAGVGAESRLYLRAIDEFDARPVFGSEGAQGPFFSPQGNWVGFFARGQLFKAPAAGGKPERICAAAWSFPGASWGAYGTIVYAAPHDGLWRISARGGTASRLTRPDPSRGELNHGLPHVLPDGRGVLFTVATTEGNRIALVSLEGGNWEYVTEVGFGANPLYLTSGYLVFGRSGSLNIVRFDPDRGKARGSPIEADERVFHESWTGFRVNHFALSDQGTLIYAPEGDVSEQSRLVWVDRKGAATVLLEERGDYRYPRLSPDGQQLAVTRMTSTGADIWVHDLKRETHLRLTTRGVNVMPVWSPDGTRIAFASSRSGVMNLYSKPSDGVGEAEPLLADGPSRGPRDWSPDGKLLAFEQGTEQGKGADIWLLSTGSAGEAEPFLATSFDERAPRFSPDGSVVAYSSDESGRFEVYAATPRGDRRRRILSSGGGAEPVWARNGRALFYRQNHRMMAVDVPAEGSLVASKPRVLFEGRFGFNLLRVPNYDVSPDGSRFVMIAGPSGGRREEINVASGWLEEQLRRRDR